MADLTAAIKQAEEALAITDAVRRSAIRGYPDIPDYPDSTMTKLYSALSLSNDACSALLSAAREAEARAEKAEAALAGGGK